MKEHSKNIDRKKREINALKDIRCYSDRHKDFQHLGIYILHNQDNYIIDSTDYHFPNSNHVIRLYTKNTSISPQPSAFEKQFYSLSKKWKKEVGGYSTMIHITGNDNYLDIIGMGKDVVPLILKELEKEADYWFVALKHTAKPDTDPVPDDHYGDIEKMREDWLNWGKEQKLI